VLLVPSLINQWYVLDLRAGASLVAALVDAGLDVWCLDWGAPEDEDRYRTWDDTLARLDRMVRRTLRTAGASQLALLGYCMGGTLATIYTALEPGARLRPRRSRRARSTSRKGGMLRTMVDRRWFDADAIADAGNVSPEQMQSGFTALRPTLELGQGSSAMPELALDRSPPTASARSTPGPATTSRSRPPPIARTSASCTRTTAWSPAPTARSAARSSSTRSAARPRSWSPTATRSARPAAPPRCSITSPPATRPRCASPAVTSARSSAAAPSRELYPALARWLDARLAGVTCARVHPPPDTRTHFRRRRFP
jgi:hypothetical protein